MSLGYLLLHQREAIGNWVRSPFDIAGLAVLGLLVELAAVVLGPKNDIFTVLEDPLIQIALILLMLPLLFKSPGLIETSRPAIAMAFVGTISYAALILNDQMRYVASLLRQEEVPNAIWWFFLVAIYFPLGTLLAYPLSRALGLLPRGNPIRATAGESEPSAPMELQPAGGA
jgi:peptidoglycan/LPS O-acetylase OafA/YrhL